MNGRELKGGCEGVDVFGGKKKKNKKAPDSTRNIFRGKRALTIKGYMSLGRSTRLDIFALLDILLSIDTQTIALGFMFWWQLDSTMRRCASHARQWQ